MKHVTSSHNEHFKHLRQLATSAKHRRRTAQTILEGIHLCQSYLQQAGRPLLCTYTDAAAAHPEAAAIISACEGSGIETILLGEVNFRAISTVESGIGLVFVIDMPTGSASPSSQATTLLLEDVQDPGNMGTMLRTAAAAGVEQVVISQGSASAWSPKVLRAGMGAQFTLTIHEQADLAEFIRASDVPVLATSLGATATIYEKDLSGPVAWLFGNEGSGVSDALLSLSVEKVIIPQSPQVESLNVAASVAVCLFEQVRQQQHRV